MQGLLTRANICKVMKLHSSLDSTTYLKVNTFASPSSLFGSQHKERKAVPITSRIAEAKPLAYHQHAFVEVKHGVFRESIVNYAHTTGTSKRREKLP